MTLTVFLICMFMAKSLFAADLMITDFENDGVNSLGGGVGSWNINSSDESHKCNMSIVHSFDVMGKKSSVLKISYSVNSSVPANGIYIELNGADLTTYDQLSMLIRGDKNAGFTKRFQLEFKNMQDQQIIYYVDGITSQWQRIAISLKELAQKNTSFDWSKMKEIVFTFHNLVVSNNKTGVLYVDDIMASSSEK